MRYTKLIEFFAKYKVEEIRNVPEFVAYCAANTESFGFREELDKAETAKKAIEVRLDPFAGAKQVSRALMLLESQRGLDFDLYLQLIELGYKPAWSPDQQSYFDHVVRIVRTGNDFFLSFTSRGPEGLGGKAVNQRYWYFVQRTVPFATNGDRKERNLLADAIDTIFRAESLQGFYYKRHENDNSGLERELREACASCLVFVQLVDNAMFKPPKEPNFCKFEYEWALDYIRQFRRYEDDRVLFLVTEKTKDDLPNPMTVYAPYGTWVEYILDKKAVYLPPVPTSDKAAFAKINALLAGVVAQVKAAKKQMFEWVPD